MANKAISELPQALNVNNQDLFVIEQGGLTKKLPAETLITEQGIIDALATALDGHGGIQSVTLSSVSGRIRTYLITFTDGSATTFQVYDGTTIERISRTSSSGLQDTYTIFMSDGTTTFFTVTNGADGTVSEAMLNDALKDKAPAITETTESSAIANFTDGADNMVMHNVVVEINPVQSGSGDPSPSNIRPISGWTGCNVSRTGKNLMDSAEYTGTKNGVNYEYKNGVWKLTGTASATAWLDLGSGVALPSGYAYKITVIPIKSRRTSSDNMLIGCTVAYVTMNGAKASNQTAVLSSARNTNLSLKLTSGQVYDDEYQMLLEFATLATTEFDPPQAPTTVSLSWSTEAGTVYGGTIDVATGLLTVDRGIITDFSTLWQTPYAAADGTYRWGITVSNVYSGESQKSISSFAPYKRDFNYGGIRFFGYSNAINIFLPNDNRSEVLALLDGQQIVYELATPQTYQLTEQQLMTLLGTNNVWADTGNTSVTYPADTKMFIEKLTMPTEDDLVANQAITSGKYFMIGNSLYLALANIASGAQITIGTNAQRVSLADALNTINS